MAITKERFRKIAASAIESCVAIPDDIWSAATVRVVLRLGDNYEVVVELRDAEEPDDDYKARTATLNRYEEALRQIAHGDHSFKTLPTDIARAALGDD